MARILRCEYSGACKQGRCTEGHKGPACRVCKEGFAYDALENKCTKCSGKIYYTVIGFLGVAGVWRGAVQLWRAGHPGRLRVPPSSATGI